MKYELGMHETLEILELNHVALLDESADLWRRALSFLRTNKTLKSLAVYFAYPATESSISAFCIDITCMLQDNTSLESISMQSWYGCIKIKADDYFQVVTALQHNTALRSLNFHRAFPIRWKDDESKQTNSLAPQAKLCIGKVFQILIWGFRGRCGRHFATEWSRTSVSGSRRILHLKRHRSVEQA
jgi:hypothetical protein